MDNYSVVIIYCLTRRKLQIFFFKGFLNDAAFLADVCSAFGVSENLRSGEAGGGMMPGMHEDGAERGRKRPESDDEDEDAENKHLRMMTADEQRRYLRENHSQIEKRRRDKMNTHIKVNIAKVFFYSMIRIFSPIAGAL